MAAVAVRKTSGRGAHLRPVPPATVVRLRLEERSFGAQPVLGRVSFDLGAGERVALVGPSGIGKSTLLRILAGVDQGYRGTCDVSGKVAMVFQEPVLLPWRSAVANLTLTTGIDATAAEAALAEVGLAGLGQCYPGQLSLGQQRRLSLARGFAAAPDLLLLDEAFVSLDPETLEEMYALFEAMVARRRVTVVLVTHDVREAARLANRVLRLEGRPARLVD